MKPFDEAVRGQYGTLRGLSVRPLAGQNLAPLPQHPYEHRPHVRVLDDAGFRRRVRVVEFALWSRPIMSGDEVALLLGLAVRGPRWHSMPFPSPRVRRDDLQASP